MATEVRPILKQFVVWGTALLRKYQDDLFFRTTIHVIALQAGLVVVSLAAFAWTLYRTNTRVLGAVLHFFPESLSSQLPSLISAIQGDTLLHMFLAMVALVMLFGILLAYATLRPARESLHYQKLFISNIAHELRTPLSTIKTATEVALLDDRLSKSLQGTFTQTVVELDRISDIINNLLSLNRLLRPERMEFTDVDLGGLVAHVAERVEALAKDRNIQLMTKTSGPSIARGNTAALEQVVENLLKNAIHYTPKGREGVVTIQTKPGDREGFVTLSVKDNGIGIAQRDLFHIFEPFYRSDLSRARNVKKGGSGLGLAIVSEITRLHRGKIHVQSILGTGTTVSVVLPSGTKNPPLPPTEKSDASLNEISVDYSKSR